MMQALTVDFETYYDRDYSLSKMTTEEYIRDPRFEVIGVSVKVDEGKPVWFSGPKKKVREFLDQYDWDNSVSVAHNAMFDMAILNWHLDIRPKRIADTVSMARALHNAKLGSMSLKSLAEFYGIGEKGVEVENAVGLRRVDFPRDQLARYGEYCMNDADLTYGIFCLMAQRLPKTEFKLIDLTTRMFTEPVLVLDKQILYDHLLAVRDKKESLLNQCLITKENLMSNPQLAETLRTLGVVPPMKISPTTGKETYAFAKTDEEFKALLEHENIIVQTIVAARLGVKSTLEETRTERFRRVAKRGTLPIPLRYYAAHTGRWGGTDKVNMQNLPRKSPLKKAIRAPDGYLLVDCDSSQIEARVLAWLAGQEDLVQAFENGEDVYKIMASSIYGVPVEEVEEKQRFVGKTTVLGCGYGLGAAKFKLQLKVFGVDMPLMECKRIISVYRETYERIPALWSEAADALDALVVGATTRVGREGVLAVDGHKQAIVLPNGLDLAYKGLRYAAKIDKPTEQELVYLSPKGRAWVPKRIWGGACVENLCQALARIVIGEQMLAISQRYKVVMTVHDSVVALVKVGEATEARAFIESCMRARPDWAPGLPLNCESKIGESYDTRLVL